MEEENVIEKIIGISKKIDEESRSEKADNEKITKLMFEQMLKGLSLNSTMF